MWKKRDVVAFVCFGCGYRGLSREILELLGGDWARALVLFTCMAMGIGEDDWRPLYLYVGNKDEPASNVCTTRAPTASCASAWVKTTPCRPRYVRVGRTRFIKARGTSRWVVAAAPSWLLMNGWLSAVALMARERTI